MKFLWIAIIFLFNFSSYAKTSIGTSSHTISSIDDVKVTINPHQPGIFESEKNIVDYKGEEVIIRPPWSTFTFLIENHTKMEFFLIEIAVVVVPKMAPMTETYRRSFSMDEAWVTPGSVFEYNDPIYLPELPYQNPPSNYSSLEMVVEFVLQDTATGEFYRVVSTPYLMKKP